MKITTDLLIACDICLDGANFANNYFLTSNTTSCTFEEGRNALHSYMNANPTQTQLRMEWYEGLLNNPVAVKYYNDYKIVSYGFLNFDANYSPTSQWDWPTGFNEYDTLEDAQTARSNLLEEYIDSGKIEIFSVKKQTEIQKNSNTYIQLTSVVSNSLTEESSYLVFNYNTKSHIICDTLANTITTLNSYKQSYMDYQSPIMMKIVNSDGDYAWTELS